MLDTCIVFQHKSIIEIEKELVRDFSSLCEWFVDNKLNFFLWFFLIGIHSLQAEQPLQGMELQEKEMQKDWGMQKICLEKTYS